MYHRPSKVLSAGLSLALMCGLAVPAAAVDSQDNKTPLSYTDVEGHWARNAIERWSSYDVIHGFGEEFRPNESLTRAQMAVILTNSLGLTRETSPNPFSDVPGDSWYTDAILRCHAAGIILGSGGMAQPEQTITREQSMVMLGRALGIAPNDDPDLTTYSDADQVSDWAAGYVSAMVESGIVNGVGDHQLAPVDTINRASVMTILDRTVVQYINEPGTYELADKDGLILIASDDVTLTGKTSADLLITPAAQNGTLSFQEANVTGAITVQAEELNVNISESSKLPELTMDGGSANVKKDPSGQPDSLAPKEVKAVHLTSGVNFTVVPSDNTVGVGGYVLRIYQDDPYVETGYIHNFFSENNVAWISNERFHKDVNYNTVVVQAVDDTSKGDSATVLGEWKGTIHVTWNDQVNVDIASAIETNGTGGTINFSEPIPNGLWLRFYDKNNQPTEYGNYLNWNGPDAENTSFDLYPYDECPSLAEMGQVGLDYPYVQSAQTGHDIDVTFTPYHSAPVELIHRTEETQPYQPQKPEGAGNVWIDTTSRTLRWDEADGADTYCIGLYQDGNSKIIHSYSLAGNQDILTYGIHMDSFADEPAGTYDIVVTAKTGEQETDIGTLVNGFTSSFTEAPVDFTAAKAQTGNIYNVTLADSAPKDGMYLVDFKDLQNSSGGHHSSSFSLDYSSVLNSVIDCDLADAVVVPGQSNVAVIHITITATDSMITLSGSQPVPQTLP